MPLLPSDLIRLGGLPNEADRKLIKFCRKTLVRSAVISLRSFISSPTAGWVGQAAELGFNLTAKQSNLAGGFPMRSIFAVLLSSLAVLCALFVLISEDRSTPSSADLIQREKTSDASDRLVQALMLRRQRSDYSNTPNTDQVSKAQEVLKNDGIYSGPVDGRMSQDTREAIRSFQQSHQLNMTGTIDDETARELGLQAEWFIAFHESPSDFKKQDGWSGNMPSAVPIFGCNYCPCFLCRRLKKAQSTAPDSGFAGKRIFRVMIIDEPW
jgi:hypothetical protein